MRVKCGLPRCQKVAAVNAHFVFCPYCATRYIAKGIDVPYLVAREKKMENYFSIRLLTILVSGVLRWSGALFVPLHFGIIDHYVVAYFFNVWLITLPILWLVGIIVLNRFLVRPKFKDVYQQPNE